MEVGYDKAALQEYMDQVGIVGEQMHRRQDKSLNLFNSCKQQYNRIHTKLEEVAHRAYNRVENAASMRRSAELEYETARRTAENAEDEDTKNATAQRMQRAQVMRAEADEEYAKASVAYTKASADLRSLSELWDGNAPALESQAHRVEDGMASFSRLVANGNSDLSEYMSIMDKAQAALYGESGESAGSNESSSFSGGAISSAGTLSSIAHGGQNETGSSFKSKLGNIVCIVAGTNGLKTISMRIDGKTRSFPNTKSGIAKAYRDALKSGDSELASYTSQIFSSSALIGETVNSDVAGFVGSSSFASSNNNQIAAAMIVDGLVGQADFGKLDNRTAQDIHKSVSETLEMFPDIDLRFVGSVQSRNEHIKNSLEQMYLGAYRQHYPTASDADLMSFVRQQVAEDMKGFEPGERTIAQSLFIETPQTCGEDIIAGFNGISINERYGGDYDHFTNVRKSDVQAKWKPAGCDTPRATVDHELGHQIARLTNAHNDADIQEMYSAFMRLTNTQQGEALSGYAGESIHEFIAEGWSEYRNNPNCRPLATNISNRLFDLYNQNTPHLVKVRR